MPNPHQTAPREDEQPQGGGQKNIFQNIGDGFLKGVDATKKTFGLDLDKPLRNPKMLEGTQVMLLVPAVREIQLAEMVKMMAGRVSPSNRADLATHCIVSEGLGQADLLEYREQLEICQALGVVVVEPSWLQAAANAARTSRDAKWSNVLIDSHVP